MDVDEEHASTHSVSFDTDKYLKGFTPLSQNSNNFLSNGGSNRKGLVHTATNSKGYLASSWQTSENLLIFAASNEKVEKQHIGNDQMCNPIVMYSSVVSKELRQLICAGHDIFLNFPDSDSTPTPQSDFMEVSQKYRQALKRTIFRLHERLNGKIVEEETKDLHAEEEDTLEVMKVFLAIWHLCEIFLFRERTQIPGHLVNWVHEHYSQLNADEQAIMASLNPENIDSYWDFLYALVLSGNSKKACAVLSLHSQRSSPILNETFDKIDQLLIAMPKTSNAPNSEDSRSWKIWHQQCIKFIQSDRNVRNNPELMTLIKILVAEEKSLVENTQTWYELLAAKLLLGNPDEVPYCFDALMSRCLELQNVEKSPFDCIMLTIMGMNLTKAVPAIEALGFSWGSTHLFDLLVRSGHLQNSTIDALDSSVNEQHLFEYAEKITGYGLWQQAIGYYKNCKSFGKLGIVSVLERQCSKGSDFNVHKLLSICQKLNLSDLSQDICLARGMEWQHRVGGVGPALYWFLKSKNMKNVNAICENIIDKLMVGGLTTDLNQLVDFLEPYAKSSYPKLISFLTKFRELLLVLEDCNVLSARTIKAPLQFSGIGEQLKFVNRQAAIRYSELFASKIIPPKYVFPVLQMALPFIEMKPPVFGSSDIFLLIDSLESTKMSFRSNEYFVGVSEIDVKKIRLALSNALSNSVIVECARVERES